MVHSLCYKTSGFRISRISLGKTKLFTSEDVFPTLLFKKTSWKGGWKRIELPNFSGIQWRCGFAVGFARFASITSRIGSSVLADQFQGAQPWQVHHAPVRPVENDYRCEIAKVVEFSTWKISKSTPAWSVLVPNQPYPYCKWPTLQLLSALIAEYPSGWITSDQYQIVFHQFCGWRSIYLTWLYELICIFEVLIQVYIYIWTHIHVMSQPKTPINC